MARPRIRQRTKRVALVNQKGGVGKTTWAMLMAAAAAEKGARVLYREMDPQANGADALEPEEGDYTMNDVLKPDDETGEVVAGSLGSAIRRTGSQWPRDLFMVPAHVSLQGREGDSGCSIPRERRLQIVSEGALDPFDLVVTDCPPSVGQLTINALTDSDEAHIVATPTSWGVSGARQANRTIARVQKWFNPELVFGGAWINMYHQGRIESEARKEELISMPEFEGKILGIVRDYEVIRKAAGAHSPLSAYGAEGSEADGIFRDMAERVLNS
jgi:chromosome partitioning protein